MKVITGISTDLMDFLKELKDNNTREWFTERKTEFNRIQEHTKTQFNLLFGALKVHDDVDHLKIFRIYRDIRFSKNKTPYKNHFSGSFQRRKPELRGGYYLHIEPHNKTYIAVGFWNPSKEDLFRIRKEFEMDDDAIRTIMSDPKFKETWGDFTGEELKTAPKGFDKEHPAIDLIRRKQFVFIKFYTDKQVLNPNFMEQVDTSFKIIRPYLDYMTEILNTDLNGESLL